MNEHMTELPRVAPPDLNALVRRAKLDDAERSSVIAELRGAEQARLELLRDALEPVFAQVPAQAELFDHGLVPGDKPRLFVDIVSFVEMARDRRCYRFIQDTRGGTLVLAESDKIEAITQEIANYLARRLIEREKALSAPYFRPSDRQSHKESEISASEGASQTPATIASQLEASAHARGAAGWQLLATLILGAVVGAALAYAYKAGQFEHIWPIRW